jgi:RNA polymerase sigma factor (sigma-70 family)
MTPDSELLRQFAKTDSEDAFAELVKRHVNLVYSAALRQVNGDEHFAKDVAQTVFIDLARKADSLSRREILTGWLYTSAHFAAAKIVRGENRRRDREEKFMRETIHETAPEADWKKLCPTLDDAMHELKEADREAILLRYFENRQFAEVGAKLGLNENAARMRVERALEKLRDIFTKRGITTATALASVISANAIQIAPANLAATLTTASIASAGTGTLTLLKIMTATKLKLAISALVVAAAATALVVQHQTQEKLRTENESLTQQITQLQTDNESLSNRLTSADDSKSFSNEQMNELLKLRGEVGVLRQQTNELGKLRQENQKLHTQAVAQNQSVELSPEDKYTLDHSHAIAAAGVLANAMQKYAKDHNGQFPTSLDQLKASGYLGADNLAANIGLEDFELVNAGLVNDSMPDKIIVRQRVPYQNANGKWVREYGLANGSVDSQYSDDENFDAFEQQHSPQPNQ